MMEQQPTSSGDFRISDRVLHNDHQLIVMNKPVGWPVQRDQSGDKSVLDLAEIYTRRKLHLINRLDRPASGVTLLAKSSEAAAHLSQQYQDQTIHKTYLALVEGQPIPDDNQLHHYLRRDPLKRRTHVSVEPREGYQEVELSYTIVHRLDRYTALRIETATGYFHQIRAQLSAIGHPIKGDVKYGARRRNRDRSIHLHAWTLQCIHPGQHMPAQWIAPLPEDSLWHLVDRVL